MCEPRLRPVESTLEEQVTGQGKSNLFGEQADRGQGSDN